MTEKAITLDYNQLASTQIYISQIHQLLFKISEWAATIKLVDEQGECAGMHQISPFLIDQIEEMADSGHDVVRSLDKLLDIPERKGSDEEGGTSQTDYIARNPRLENFVLALKDLQKEDHEWLRGRLRDLNEDAGETS